MAEFAARQVLFACPVRAAFEPGRANSERISAVQYIRFPVTREVIETLSTPGAQLAIEIDHPEYRHSTPCDDNMRQSLAADFETTE